MQLADSHHHLWIPEQTNPEIDPGYVWLRDIGAPKPFGDPTPIQRDYEWPEFATESQQHELVASVYLQVDGAIKNPVAETAWVESVFKKTGLQHGIVGFANLAKADAADVIAQQAGYASFKGVRQILSRLDDNPALSFAGSHLMRDPQWQDSFASLADMNLSFDMQLYPEQMAEAAELLARYPSIPVIIDHAGSPHDQSTEGLKAWEHSVSILAQLPQVSVKLCGFGMFDQQWTTQSIQPITDGLLNHFGSERLLFGSNFPVDKLMATYDSVVNNIDAALQGISATERDAIFSGNAKRVYSL